MIKTEQITKSYLKEQDACSESYGWLEKQKNKNWRVIAKKLYAEKKYDWCLWLLYRKTLFAKIIIWFLVICSFILSGISFYISLSYYEGNSSIAAVAAVAVGVAGVAGAAGVAGVA